MNSASSPQVVSVSPVLAGAGHVGRMVVDTPTDGGDPFEDIIRGRDVVVRFEWLNAQPEQPRWQQSFSYDGGRTWTLNWTMQFTACE